MKNRSNDVLLIYPRYRYWLASSLEEPLGLIYVATAARLAGWNVKLVDLTFEKNLSKIEAALDNGLIAAAMSVTTPLLDPAIEVLDFIKKRRPSLPVIMGGPHCAALPGDGLDRGFDYLLTGEGEQAFVSLLEGIRKGDTSEVKGVTSRGPDGTLRGQPPEPIPDLDAIPFPDRSYLDYGRYEKVGLITMRGCPFHCYFCKPMQDKIFGNKIRRRSPDNVVQEVAGIVRLLGNRIIHFRDDTFTLGTPAWFVRFRDLIRQSLPGGIHFHCSSRVDQVNEEKMRLIKEAGCCQIFFGVESGSQKILDFYRKGTTPEQAVDAFRLCRK